MKIRIFLLILLISILSGCAKKEEKHPSEPTIVPSIPASHTCVTDKNNSEDLPESEENNEEKIVDKGTARLKSYETEEYRDVTIKKGADIEIPHILG